jgi:hypothetical protein
MTLADHAPARCIDWIFAGRKFGAFEIDPAQRRQCGAVATKPGLQNTIELIDAKIDRLYE